MRSILTADQIPALRALPERRGVCTPLYTSTPKKPNSRCAARLAPRPATSAYEVSTAIHTRIGHNLQRALLVCDPRRVACKGFARVRYHIIPWHFPPTPPLRDRCQALQVSGTKATKG